MIMPAQREIPISAMHQLPQKHVLNDSDSNTPESFEKNEESLASTKRRWESGNHSTTNNAMQLPDFGEFWQTTKKQLVPIKRQRLHSPEPSLDDNESAKILFRKSHQ